METKLLIVGKGDNVITMITDNLYSVGVGPKKIDIYNNLNLEVVNNISHPYFDMSLLTEVNFDDYNLICLGVYQPKLKRILMEKYNIDENKLYDIIHKGLIKSETVVLGKGLLVNSLVTIAAHTTIEDYVSINRSVSIGHHTTIGKYSSINPGTNIAGNVIIGEGTTIGMGSNIINGVTIGKNTIIGAGSLITKDIPDNVVAYGNPCKIIRDNV
jgi:sugar O-acyltransferase (sialic acid O-acetyltransferase NeuD family)